MLVVARENAVTKAPYEDDVFRRILKILLSPSPSAEH